MYNRELMNLLDISFDDLNNFYEFYSKQRLKKSKESLLMKYFPHLVSPAPKRRLDFIESYLKNGNLLDVGLGSGWIDFI